MLHQVKAMYSLVENSVTKLTKIQHKSVDFFVDLDVLIWVVFSQKNVDFFVNLVIHFVCFL